MSHLAAGNHSGSGTSTVVLVLFIVFGAVQAIRPDLSWKMRRWQYRNPQALAPSAAALTVTRVAGVALVVAGVVLLIVK